MKRPTLKPRKTTLAKWPWCVNLPPTISGSGKRERSFFKTKAEADTFCLGQRTRLENYGRNSTSLSPGQIEQAAQAFAKLPPGVSLNEVVSDYLARHEQLNRSVTFKVMADKFTAAKTDKSEAYGRAIRYALNRCAPFHDRLAATITRDDIEAVTADMPRSAKNAFLRIVRAVFNFGVAREWLVKNPAASVDFEDVVQTEVVTLTPTQAASIMQAATESLDLLPYHAIALFAGVRPMEIERLQWSDIDLAERHITIRPEASKTRRRRIIDMEPTLAAWLEYYAAQGGAMTGAVVGPVNLRRRLDALRTAAGIEEWPQDVMRHSYASFWLAAHENIDRLCVFMGHTNTAMLWAHYHRAVTKKDAARFWAITPPTTGAKIVSMKGAA